jgi:lysine/ornithine N-monooxygenase
VPELKDDEPQVYDLVGVGLGPSNLSLAILAEESVENGSDAPTSLFLEKKSDPRWIGDDHLDGMMLSEFYLDLVTPVNPRSRFTFLNYLFEHNRLSNFLSAGIVFPSRREYADYFRWISSNLKNIAMDSLVTGIKYDSGQDLFDVSYDRHRRNTIARCRNVVVGTGKTKIQTFDRGVLVSQFRKTGQLPNSLHQNIAVIGTGQSAAELVASIIDLLNNGSKLTWVTRSSVVGALDTSAWNQSFFFQNGLTEFRSLPSARQGPVNEALANLISGVEQNLLADVMQKIYYRRLHHQAIIETKTQCEITSVVDDNGRYKLLARDQPIGSFDIVFDCRGYSLTQDLGQIEFELGDLCDSSKREGELGRNMSSSSIRKIFNFDQSARCVSEQNFISAPFVNKTILREIRRPS